MTAGAALALLLQPHLKDGHGVGFGLFGNVDIWFHGFVVGVTGPFHDDLGRDAGGEGEADEGTAAGMGTDVFVFGLGLFNPLCGSVVGLCDRLVDLAQLAQGLEVLVHLLVADDREGQVARKLFILVLVQDLFCEGVQVDGEAVVGLLGGHVEDVARDVRAFDLCHVGVAQAGECAEAEEVTGLGERPCFRHFEFVFVSVVVVEGDHGLIFRYLVGVELQELFFGEEDDRFLQDFEFDPVAVDAVLLGVAFPDGPVEKPFQVGEVLLDCLFFQILGDAQEADELVEAVFVEV